MPFVQGKCPECGGMLAVDNNEKASICLYCGKAFVVKEAINNFNSGIMTNNNNNRARIKKLVCDYTSNLTSIIASDSQSSDFIMGAFIYSKTLNKYVQDPYALKKYVGKGGDVVIPKGVSFIGTGAFEDCINLTSVTIPRTVLRIGDSAFCRCSNLKTVTIPGSVDIIGDCAFYDCKSLSQVTIEEGVKEIGSLCFVRCDSLTSIKIPNSVKIIDEYAFDDNCEFI